MTSDDASRVAALEWLPPDSRFSFDRWTPVRVRYVGGKVDDRTGPICQWAWTTPGSVPVEAFALAERRDAPAQGGDDAG